MDARMRGAIDQHGVARTNERGQGGDVSEARRPRCGCVPPRHLPQQVFELLVQGRVEVSPGERELAPVTLCRVDDAVLQLSALVEPHVTATAEVQYGGFMELEMAPVILGPV